MNWLIKIQQKLANMVVAFRIGNLIICNWGVFCLIGAFVGILLIYHNLLSFGLSNKNIDEAVIGLCVASFVGSKLLGLLTNWNSFTISPMSALKVNRFNFYGGAFACIIFIIVFSFLTHTPILILSDSIALAMPLVQSIGRLGCLAHGCCHGKPTISKIGVLITNPNSVAIRLSKYPLGVKLFPIQTITSGANLLLFLFLQLLVIDQNDLQLGFVSAMYLVFDNIIRYLIDFHRGEKTEPGILGITIHQVFAILFFVLGIILFIYLLMTAPTLVFNYEGISFCEIISILCKSILPISIGLFFISMYAFNYRVIGKI